MQIKKIIAERFDDYKKVSMFLCAISCNFKCCTEARKSKNVCQNHGWANNEIFDIPDTEIAEQYLSNPITSAIVIGGLEPFDQSGELVNLIHTFRVDYRCDDDIVIYTGYTEAETSSLLSVLSSYSNIIIKFGRYIPNQPKHLDPILGVELASPNQYAKLISSGGGAT